MGLELEEGMREMTKAYRGLGRKLDGKRLFVKPTIRREDNIEMGLK